MTPSRGSLSQVGQSLTGAPVQIPDILADPESTEGGNIEGD